MLFRRLRSQANTPARNEGSAGAPFMLLLMGSKSACNGTAYGGQAAAASFAGTCVAHVVVRWKARKLSSGAYRGRQAEAHVIGSGYVGT
jgi:hypothetical protein